MNHDPYKKNSYRKVEKEREIIKKKVKRCLRAVRSVQNGCTNLAVFNLYHTKDNEKECVHT